MGAGRIGVFHATVLAEDRRLEKVVVGDAERAASLAERIEGYPPHKHDREDPPRERYLEVTYYHRLRPERDFAL